MVPQPRIKKKKGKRIFPMRPKCSQALNFYTDFRLNHRLGSWLCYVDDVAYGGSGSPVTKWHRGNFDNYLKCGERDSNIKYKKAEGDDAGKIVHARPGQRVTFGGIDLWPQPTAALGLPDDKRRQNMSLLKGVLDAQPSGHVPFRILEALLGKLGWWANIDRTIWCYLVPLQWHCASFMDSFEEKPTDPRELVSDPLGADAVSCMSFLHQELANDHCRVSSRQLVHLPEVDGSVAFICDAAGSQREGIGLLLLGVLSTFEIGVRSSFSQGGQALYGIYPTNFEANLRQNAKEMLGAFLGVLRWAPLARDLGLPLLVVTDNMTVFSTFAKARSGSYEVWRIFKALMDFVRPMGVQVHASWLCGKAIQDNRSCPSGCPQQIKCPQG